MMRKAVRQTRRRNEMGTNVMNKKTILTILFILATMMGWAQDICSVQATADERTNEQRHIIPSPHR
jgi:hypothetical protein